MENLQTELFPEIKERSEKAVLNSRSGTFIDNMKLPVHRWFKYSAGYSAEWVENLVEEKKPRRVLDPFVGSGTTVVACNKIGVPSVGYESHSFVNRIAATKVSFSKDTKGFVDLCRQIAEKSAKLGAYDQLESDLLIKCYDEETLDRLFRLRFSFLEMEANEWSDLIWLCITSILRPCSKVGTAQWQYVLPNKRKSKVLEPYDAFLAKANLIAEDIEVTKEEGWKNCGEIISEDVRNPSVQRKKFDLVITSPPYPNNYDYADATRLEMSFWGEIERWKDLQPVVRKHLVRACSQHSSAEKLTLDELYEEESIKPIKDELITICDRLGEVRLDKRGKKNYHTMIAAYFADLGKIWNWLGKVCADDATACFIIGDSAPYGVYVPVDEWLMTLASEAGFPNGTFEKLRDRNIKWKNRKHRVPLKEGRLWVKR